MKKNFSRMLAGLCSLALCIGMMGCSNSTQNSTSSAVSTAQTDDLKAELRMSWWGGDARHEATLAALDEFSKMHPDIQVAAEYQGYDGYHDKMFTQLVGGTAPDLFQYDPQSLPEAVRGGKVLSLNEYIENGMLNVDNIPAGALSATTIDGEIYGIPMSTQTICTIYNKTLFDKAGVEYPEDDWTWDDYDRIIHELAEKLPEGVYASTDLRVHDKGLLSMVHQDGGRYMNEDGTVGFEESIVEPLERFQKYMEDGLIPPVELSVSKTDNEIFTEGKAAIHMNFNAMATSLQASSTDQDEYALTSVPSSNTGDRLGMYVKGEIAFCISADSPNKEAAIVLLNEFINNPEMAKILGLSRGIPPSSEMQTLLSEDTSGLNKEIFDVQKMAEESKDVPEILATPGYAQVLEVIRQETDEYRYGNKDVKTAVEDMVERANKEIKDAQG